MNSEDKIGVKWKPPTPDQLFDMFCYEMFLKNKDEKEAWENKLSNEPPTEYIEKNKSFLEKEYKRMRKKGNL